VTWVHSYVSNDKSTTFCIYDGPSPEAIRHVAELNGLPVDRITEVRVLDPTSTARPGHQYRIGGGIPCPSSPAP
jgi:hypothetical protein